MLILEWRRRLVVVVSRSAAYTQPPSGFDNQAPSSLPRSELFFRIFKITLFLAKILNEDIRESFRVESTLNISYMFSSAKTLRKRDIQDFVEHNLGVIIQLLKEPRLKPPR